MGHREFGHLAEFDYPRGNSSWMSDAQRLARALNEIVTAPQFTYVKARAAARGEAAVDWAATKAFNADFNPEVDGCESFVMRDRSICEWKPGQFRYAARNP
jgi:hypothetical protein